MKILTGLAFTVSKLSMTEVGFLLSAIHVNVVHSLVRVNPRGGSLVRVNPRGGGPCR